MSKYKKEIEDIKMKLDKANRMKVQAETRMEDLKKEKKELLQEIKEYGIKPDELEEEIKSLENNLEELIEKAKDLLPDEDILQGKVR